MEMDANFAISYAVLGEAYLSKGMYREGLSALERYSTLSRSGAASLALLGYLYARTGERKKALEMIERSLRRLRSRVLYLPFSLRWLTPG